VFKNKEDINNENYNFKKGGRVMKLKKLRLIMLSLFAIMIMAIGLFGLYSGNTGKGLSLVKEAVAAKVKPQISPIKARERDFYAPNSETLASDEIRVTACGTGMPTPRPAQAAACFLMELGNGDKFIFDIGAGSAERLFALQIPTAFLDKVFIGHLHGDHFGDLGALFVAGGIAGRFSPLRVWGPSGATPELGTKAALKAMEKVYAWDIAGRLGQTDVRGFKFEINEFDYNQVNKIVYKENGVTIRSFPAIHAIDGSVSYSLEWKGLKIVFGSDSFPNKWFAEYAKDADLVIHECFITVPDLVAKYRLTPEAALQVGTQIHTAPEAFGKLMSMVKPRHAVAYHFFKDTDTTGPILERIRTTYDGPLSLAEDYMVWNVTKDGTRERMAVIDEHTWNPPLAYPAEPVKKEDRIGYSPEIEAGKLDMSDVLKPIYKEASEAVGREFKYPTK
jgi:ribonuclease Z